MYCKKCGEPLKNNVGVCPYCGAGTNDTAKTTHYVPEEIEKPETSGENEPAEAAVDQQPAEHSMGWYKFLIYVSLFASAVINAINAFASITGSMYGEYRNEIHILFPGLMDLDIFYGLCLLGLAVLALVTRHRLANFNINGPKLLTALYLGGLLVNIIYPVGCSFILPGYNLYSLANASDLSLVTTYLIPVFMMIFNYKYFSARKDMFIYY